MYGTAAGHSVMYYYSFVNVHDVYAGHIQHEKGPTTKETPTHSIHSPTDPPGTTRTSPLIAPLALPTVPARGDYNSSSARKSSCMGLVCTISSRIGIPRRVYARHVVRNECLKDSSDVYL
jgi:hypothetical protein